MDPNFTRWMEETFALAQAARGTTLPNPAVGCIVLDRTGKPLAKASTSPGGRPHAERAALEKAGARARGGYLFATLEPCVAFPGKKSPPCAAAIILSGVETVVVGSRDPNPLVGGKGIHAMRKAGIKVVELSLEDRIPDFYAGFGHFLTTHRPRVTLKAALSADHMATAKSGTRTAITGQEAKRFTHELRAASDLVLVGGATARIDDPQLTVRDAPGRSPRRAVLWPRTGLSASLKLFQGPSCMAIGCGPRPADLPASAQWLEVPGDGDHASIAGLLDQLGEQGFHDVLVETGPRLAKAFLDSKLWDRFCLIRSPTTLGGGVAFELPGLPETAQRQSALGLDTASLFLRPEMLP
ncbi:MAG: bifunctional diaminohydroxyphosphoribosylaminopyrimidine deaminase/5-amino-6-(5-phosphoribosylamino)uracil reductase RibD [Fibrobacteres bacterium]|nr:bifunctional diaminohydroxyphosphoribosylaminopyrimidine deaminase/5-amino-6-(5-phosphoribosylamino)uracil reductase RibD [Fibrobacterota bacterium]